MDVSMKIVILVQGTRGKPIVLRWLRSSFRLFHIFVLPLFNHIRTKVLATSDHDIFVLTGYTVSPARWDTYFLVNRVENQKLNQTTAELPFG